MSPRISCIRGTRKWFCSHHLLQALVQPVQVPGGSELHQGPGTLAGAHQVPLPGSKDPRKPGSSIPGEFPCRRPGTGGTGASPQPTWIHRCRQKPEGKGTAGSINWLGHKLPLSLAPGTCTCRGTLRSLRRWTFSHWDLFL